MMLLPKENNGNNYLEMDEELGYFDTSKINKLIHKK